MVHGVVQRHVAWLLVVTLTNEPEGVVLQSSRWRCHVEEFSALWRQLSLHLRSHRGCYYVDKKESRLCPKCHCQEGLMSLLSEVNAVKCSQVCFCEPLQMIECVSYISHSALSNQDSICKTAGLQILSLSRSTHS